MLPALACALVLAPLFAFAVPERWRREVLVALSLAGLWIIDPRLPWLALGSAMAVWGAVLAIGRGVAPGPWWVAGPGLALLLALFVFNKTEGSGGLLPSQEGLVLLGVSYLVLKASAALIDAARGSLREASLLDLVAWIVFLPTYTSGPIEELDHFRRQVPRPELGQALGGLERILFGLVKTMLLSHYLGVLSAGVLESPGEHGAGALVLAFYATTFRLYFDFSGYSDIAIGVSALFGLRIQENFDNPLVRRNLVQLWQRWHMTLTAWLRRYLFVPASRRLVAAGGALDAAAIPLAQLLTMSVCGLWHGLGWNFLLWGALQAVGMIFVASVARPLGRHLPDPWRRFWSGTRVGYGMSALLSFHYFALTNVLFFTGIRGSADFFAALLGAATR